MELNQKYFTKYGKFAHDLLDNFVECKIDNETCTVIKITDLLKILTKYFPVKLPNTNIKENNGWISTDDELPQEPTVSREEYDKSDFPCFLTEQCIEYLVMIKGARIPTHLTYIGNGEWFDKETWQEYSVSHWQPMPAPPERVRK